MMSGIEESLPIPITNGLTPSVSMNESINDNPQKVQSHNNVSDNVNEDDESWLYGSNVPSKNKNEDIGDSALAPSVDEVTTHEINSREKITAQITDDNVMDSDDDDDQIEVMIRDFKSPSIYPTARQNSRTAIGVGLGGKPPTKGVDLDAQGQINGVPTFEHDILSAFKDDEKPWKKPGADITDYFNYGFTEDTWGQYCDRQRRLRAENNLARINATSNIQHIPQIGGQIGTVVNKQIRPFVQMKKPVGTIDVIGATDQTSRRPTFETGYDHAPMQFINGPQYPPPGVPAPHPSQSGPNSSIPDLATPPPGFTTQQTMANVTSNSNQQQQSPQHGTSPQHHQIPTLGVGGPHRLPMPGMPMGPPMLRHPQFGPPPQHPFYGGPMPGVMPHERPPMPVGGPYFIPRHQQPWEKTLSAAAVSYHFPPPHNSPNVGLRSPRSATPEDHSSRSSTPEESREEKTKEDRHKDKYNRDHYDRDRRSPKDRYRHREYERSEYERPRSDRDDERRRKSKSRDRDDKYERYSRKRHHREDSRHHREDERYERTSSSHRHRNPQTSHTSFSSPPKGITTTSPDNNDEQQQASQSSSRHSKGDERDRKHKKSSKRSRRSSEERDRDREKDRGERSSGRSKDESRKSSSSNAVTATQALSTSSSSLNAQSADITTSTISNDAAVQSKEND